MAKDYKRNLDLFPEDYSKYKFFLKKEDIQEIFPERTFLDIIHTKLFLRLKKISFLGAGDYVVSPKEKKRSRYLNRYQHSLGVGRLARVFSVNKGLSKIDERHLVIAALLHDLGHMPLSHSVEPAAKNKFGVDHHSITRDLILGNGSAPKEIYKVLRERKVDLDCILKIMEGHESVSFKEALSGPINLDTIEAVCRSQAYLIKRPFWVEPEKIVVALCFPEKSQRILDDFFIMKDEFYKYIVNNDIVALGDFESNKYVLENQSFLPEHLYMSEAKLKFHHAELFDTLGKIKKNEVFRIQKTNSYLENKKRVRLFEIDSSVLLKSARDLKSRYLEPKEIIRWNTKTFKLLKNILKKF